MNAEFWDQRYGEEDYAYGTIPNEFLAETIEHLTQTGKLTVSDGNRVKVLCIAEGEGRNAIFLAKKGFEIFAMDYSQQGMRKLHQESINQGVDNLIHVEVADLNSFDFQKDAPDGWDVIVSVFAHCPTPLQARVFKEIQGSLKTNGWLIFTAYHPTNIGRGTGGPQVPDLCMTVEQLQQTFPATHFHHHLCHQQERIVNEGKYHQGLAAVVECAVQKL